MKRKILVTTGTRAEYGILRTFLHELRKNKKFKLILVVTGTHLSKKFGNTINEIKKDGFQISSQFKYLPKKDDNYSMSVELGKGIIQFSKIFKKFKPDINILIGDRDEILASAIAASHMNIPNAHIAGGDVSGGIDEYNRHAITKLSNIHFPATIASKNRIIKMGENPKYVFYHGSLNIDEVYQKKITSKKTLNKKYGLSLTGNEILLLQHSVTTETKLAKNQISKTLKALLKLKSDIITIAPNSDAGGREIFKYLEKFSKLHKNFRLFTTLPREDYLGLLKYSNLLVGNSSSGIIEASYFDIPVVNIGSRQMNRERGKNIFDVTNFDTLNIFKTVSRALKYKKSENNFVYGIGNTAQKIVKTLDSISLNDKLIHKHIMY